MKLVAIALLSALAFGATPAIASPVSADQPFKVAQASVDIRVGEPRRHRERVIVRERRGFHARRDRCKTVVIKERRGGSVITKRIKRCR